MVGLAGLVDDTHLQFRFRVDGGGVFPVTVKHLHLEPGTGQLPPRLPTVVNEGLLLPGGEWVKVRGLGEIGHRHLQFLGLNSPVGPEVIVYLLHLPALPGHPGEVPLNAGMVVKGQ